MALTGAVCLHLSVGRRPARQHTATAVPWEPPSCPAARELRQRTHEAPRVGILHKLRPGRRITLDIQQVVDKYVNLALLCNILF